jgi:uncharacterized protein with FMN-binding domain
MIRSMEVVAMAVMVAWLVTLMLVLPIIAFRRARLHNPRGRDARFAQHSERPMPDRSYLGQSDAG